MAEHAWPDVPAVIDVEYAVAAYWAYREALGWPNLDVPGFLDLPEQIRFAWAHAARAVREKAEDRQ